MNESLQTALTRLRLSGLAASLDVRLQESAGHSLSHAEFLELVLQDELLIRSERLVARRTKAAAFRELRTLDEFVIERPNPATHERFKISHIEALEICVVPWSAGNRREATMRWRINSRWQTYRQFWRWWGMAGPTGGSAGNWA